MATYVILCVSFIAVAVIVGRLYRIKNWRAALFAFAVVSILTLHFEPIMIHLDLYQHDISKTLGITVRDIPIEDFLYVVLAALIVPGVWDQLGAKKKTKPSANTK